MPQVYFKKLEELTGLIKDVKTPLWLIQLDNSDQYYIPASKAHITIDRRYWTDSKNLIPVANAITGKSVTEILYQQVECGHCGRTCDVQIDPIATGAHTCYNCGVTICIITGKRLELKNASQVGNTIRKQR